ncbi:BA75_04492T0 [Komagataella pastoris]|uniref:Malate dehydrogenase n=1 Tax=Komagataella pastoris TaxID=4922 RepID=A0A1B2JJ56_PICPA|nr:BA75_04492T0 [Komagataella pastoris]
MVKVTVCGAAGGIGQPLSLMFKLNPYVTTLALYDVVNVPGVGKDLSHIDTDTKLESYLPENDGLEKALTGSDLVIIPAGVPRKPGMTRDDLFAINAGIIRDLANGIAQFAPSAFVLVISNPVNSTVPIVAEILKKSNVFNPQKLFGVTTLDCVRANTFVAELSKDKEASAFDTRVLGGHSGETIVPVFSQSAPEVYKELSDEQKAALVHRVQFGGDEVVKAKNGAGSATLSMAYAGYKLGHALLAAINDTPGIIESTFVYLKDSKIKGATEAYKYINEKLKDSDSSDVDFFALPVVLSSNGIEEIKWDILEKVDAKETELLKIATGQLSKNIAKGTAFIAGN